MLYKAANCFVIQEEVPNAKKPYYAFFDVCLLRSPFAAACRISHA